ncbi:MAG: MarR family winged helix-turn-helix transcriptional regulator [Candidatus Phaeomarinobacter sp.]
MLDRTANLLGAVGLAVADRIEKVALEVMSRAGETPAALVVIGSGTGPSNDQLKRILNLSHPGTVRLVDRLEADGLVERRGGKDKRSIALFLTEQGHAARDKLLAGRIAAIGSLLNPLDDHEQEAFASLLHKLLAGIPEDDLERCHLCRLCDNGVCVDCPIPADFREGSAA